MIPSLSGFWGATTGAKIMPNKMHHFHSDFICYATSKSKCVWDVKSMEIVPIHEWKILVNYGGINLELCSPLLLLKSGGHHGWG